MKKTYMKMGVHTTIKRKISKQIQREEKNCSIPCGIGDNWSIEMVPPHLEWGSMLRIALLPAPNVSYLER